MPQGTRSFVGPGYAATSTTSVAVASSGSKSFTVQAGLAYSVGARIRVTSTGSAAYMEGVVTSYSGNSLVMSVELSSGAGSHADWTINLAGDRGATGETGSSGSNGQDGDDGDDGAQGNPGTDGAVQGLDMVYSAAGAGSGLAAGQVGFNGSATSIFMWKLDSQGVNIAPYLATLHSGDVLYLAGNDGVNLRGALTSEGVDHTDWIEWTFSLLGMAANLTPGSHYGIIVSPKGATGANGADGDDGEDGNNGTNGDTGPTGATGATGPGYLATSNSTVETVGSGVATFTTQAGLAYTVGARVRATDLIMSTYMEGVVSSYSGTSLAFTIDRCVGFGSHASWRINLAGDVGATGAQGIQGEPGTNGTDGDDGDDGAPGAPGAAKDPNTYTPADTQTVTLDLSDADVHYITLPASGAITIAVTNATLGQPFIVFITMGAAPVTITWFTTIRWFDTVESAAPEITGDAGDVHMLGFIVRSSGNYEGNLLGFHGV